MENRKEYFQKLVDLMRLLRSPDGCPWDREQDRETLKPMLIEEAHEVLEALDSEDADDLCEELGDLLFQVIFHCQIAEECNEFDAFEVCKRVYLKMVRRHPHVFGDVEISDSDELLRNWEDLKAAEKKAAGKEEAIRDSMMDGIPKSLPAMYKTYQVTAKASRVGFDWSSITGIREKVFEEFDELEEALEQEDSRQIKEEVGDLLFAALNVARFLEIDPETALNQANAKFEQRFRSMEQVIRDRGNSLKDTPLEEMEAVWQANKVNGA
ncbi:MAG: nucleoside triphosphate pyrophosphohydrolase [Acidobacteriota bacterium]|nr:MAG: nucleoside triphosphate pyrophosphohydrolase [Acidobacteriota bacterium]